MSVEEGVEIFLAVGVGADGGGSPKYRSEKSFAAASVAPFTAARPAERPASDWATFLPIFAAPLPIFEANAPIIPLLSSAYETMKETGLPSYFPSGRVTYLPSLD